MKRFFTAIVFCTSILTLLSFLLFPVTSAAEDPIAVLLNLPAPPPPNPAVTISTVERPADFFSKSKPPVDDAPLADLIAYWGEMSDEYRELGYNPKPSEKVLDRLLAAVEAKPELVHQLLNAFRESPKAADVVKKIYDQETSARTEEGRRERATLRRWLMYNSPHFSVQLAREAAKARDTNEYVSNQADLLALGRVDWDRARPIVDQLYSGNQKVSRVLAQWALYRHAIDNNSASDIERYRRELMDVVEDKRATPGMRDLAFDALVKEKEWSGRDDWYYSLLADETLAELRVNGTLYTGLTTIMYYSPDEKYVDKMLELIKSENKAVRTAAAKNLFQRVHTGNPEVIRGLLPWLSDPKWLDMDLDGRSAIITALQTVKLPESVPPLIAALDEKSALLDIPRYVNSNAASNVISSTRPVSGSTNAAVMAANAAVANAVRAVNEAVEAMGRHQHRHSAIVALGYQEDPRAVPALRRLLDETRESYLLTPLVGAIYKCGGFTIPEQVEGLELLAREADSGESGETNEAANLISTHANYAANTPYSSFPRITSDPKRTLGSYLAEQKSVKGELGRAVVARVIALDKTDSKTAQNLRRLIVKWNSPAVFTLFLQDLKNRKADEDAIVLLLSERQKLRETQQADIFDIRTGSQMAIGISACLLEDPKDLESVLEAGSDEAKTAMLACARLIRAPLSVQRVALNLQSKDKLLALAAERYLETEDSPEARKIVLALRPGEPRIMGATTAFYVDNKGASLVPFALRPLFGTVSPFYNVPTGIDYPRTFYDYEIPALENAAREDLKRDPSLQTVYNFDNHFIHVYKDRSVFSWRDDPARYHERVLSKEEYKRFDDLLAEHRADELPPFLECEACYPVQFLTMNRNGGRRVYARVETFPLFFAEIAELFEDLRQEPTVIKYWAGRDVPGLELLFADERFAATTVWKNGTDLRVLVNDAERRKEIEKELEAFADEARENEEEEDNPSVAGLAIEKEEFKRGFESMGWFGLANGAIGAAASQPAEVPYLPAQDTLEIQPLEHAWKARAGDIEIRLDETGLFKVVGGKLSGMRSGTYDDPILTSNGRWLVATKYDNGVNIVRINVQTNREFIASKGEMPGFGAVAYVPSVGKVLLSGQDANSGRYEVLQETGPPPPGPFALLDPETGTMAPATGDMAPLAQQTFRPLQPASAPFEFWAAVPKTKSTVVGVYNSRSFTFKPVLTLPNLLFDSMNMWVDAAESRVYFVYEGHLLRAPINVAGR